MAKKSKIRTVSVEEKLSALHQLQVIDTKIDKIRIVRGELPLEIKDLEDLIAGLNSRMDKFNLELESINQDILSNKNTVITSKESIEKYEKQLKNIKNNSPNWYLAEIISQ